jgi:O-antigen ligase
MTTLPCAGMYHGSPARSVGYARSRRRRRWTALTVQGCLLLASLAVGRAVVETQSIQADAPEIAVAAAAGLAALAVMLHGPVACLGAIAALTLLRLVPEVSVGSGVDLFPADAFFGALVCWWAIRAAGLGARQPDAGGDVALRGGVVLLFLGYAGMTLLYVAAVDPGRLSVSSVSWLRLVETASIGWLAATFLRTRRDLNLVLGAIAAAGAIGVVLALVGGAAEPDAGPLGLRGGGIINPNELGLVSGLLLLMAAFGALGPAPVHRVPLGLLGAVGLVQSQSVGALVGTSIALVLGLAFMVAPSRRIVVGRLLRGTAAVVLAVTVAYGLAAVIRPANLPTSDEFRDSSAGTRTVLAAAGIELLERNPVIGVGWRRSEAPDVIGDPDLNAELRSRFRGTKDEYFPDVSPASVHNAYVQVAADLGLIGLGLLALVFVSFGRSIQQVLRGVGRRTPERPQLWFLAWGLVLIVVWWNDNPLYGGQPETVLPALFVGAIAGVGGTLAAERRSRSAGGKHE